jgi:cytoskeletal protein CcmA (bactofilin family)
MAASSSSGGLSAFIDQGSEFEGKLSFKDTVRIDGRFRGEISSENTLIVGETGEIDATIRSKIVAVSGSVTGDIVAGTKVVLHKTARVIGNIETGSLVVEDGAEIDGQIKMGKGSGKLKAVEPSASAPKDESQN